MNLTRMSFFALLLSFFCLGCERAEYASGRDTLQAFGRGRFQLLILGGKQKLLYDLKLQRTLVSDVKSWQIDDDLLLILSVGAQRFTILNVETGGLQHFQVISEIPQLQRGKFEKLQQEVR